MSDSTRGYGASPLTIPSDRVEEQVLDHDDLQGDHEDVVLTGFAVGDGRDDGDTGSDFGDEVQLLHDIGVTSENGNLTQNMNKKKPRWKRVLRFCVVATVVFCLILLLRYLEIGRRLGPLFEYVREQGFGGAVIFMLVYIASTTCFFPFFLFALTAGLIWGLWIGSVVCMLSSQGSVMLSFIVSRRFLHEWAWRKLEHNEKFTVLVKAISKKGWKAVIMIRLNWLFPFAFVNHAFGLTSIKFIPYSLASFIGIAPETILYVYLGTFAASLDAITSGKASPQGPQELIILAVSLTMAIICIFVFARIAKKALRDAQLESAKSADGIELRGVGAADEVGTAPPSSSSPLPAAATAGSQSAPV